VSKSKTKPLANPLFEIEQDPEHWRGMPEFKQEDNGPYRQIIVSLEDETALKDFFKLIGQTYTDKTKSVWFPDRAMNRVSDLFWISDEDDQ
jgi:hypothetical protein